jgi:hypothetical protein
MAIYDHLDIRCWSTRHEPGRAPPAVAVVRESNAAVNVWAPRCQPCIDQLAALNDADFVLVAYLHHDPAAPGPDPAADLEPADRDRPDRP